MNLKKKINEFAERVKKLKGDPNFIASGMAIGIFVGITPTFPFHTFLAIALAYFLRASKGAAAIGVWIGNPLTIPFIYLGSYKTGALILGTSLPYDAKFTTFTELTKLGLKATIALLTGGIIIGIPPAVAAYYITRRLVKKFRSRRRLLLNQPETPAS
ncbi:MAG: DUF2062 domain-containing protein [Desulfobacteraceae bacterium]|nr:MAG: DUF2062 domain-containing protein [Desulfobacteraceae bacterium]